MKKYLTLLLVCLSFVSLFSCSKEQEDTFDPLLTPVEIDDNYKTYYEIFVHSFSDSNNDGIGDLNGLINRLDYLNDGNGTNDSSLGVDGIWLMPIMPSPSYHKYDVCNYKAIDYDYGTIDDFDNLIGECNKRNIDVIIDLVLNHTSISHPWFIEAKRAIKALELDNKYIGYYSICKSDERKSGRSYLEIANGYYYECNFSSDMPELNLDNEDVRNEIIDIISFWFTHGVKGFRLDAIKYFYYGETSKNIEFLKWFNGECEKLKKDYYNIGEDFSANNEILTYYEGINCFDFGMSSQSGAVASAVKSSGNINKYISYLESYQKSVLKVNSNAILSPFLSNHDQDRCAGYLSVDTYTYQMAASLYLLSSGNPYIYYGEEIGMKGSRGSAQTDANRRLAMLWGDSDTVKNPTGTTYKATSQINGTVKSQIDDPNSLFNHYKKLIQIRKANPEISRGIMTAINFSDYTSFGGFLSTYNGSTVGVFHNNDSEELTIDLSKYTDYSFNTVRAYVGKGLATLDGNILKISPKTSVVLK